MFVQISEFQIIRVLTPGDIFPFVGLDVGRTVLQITYTVKPRYIKVEEYVLFLRVTELRLIRFGGSRGNIHFDISD